MHTFGKHQHIASKKEYDLVFLEANKTVVNELILLHRKNTLGHARIGFALSKKNIAKANQRNRIKRIVRESFRTHTLPTIDLIVLAKKGAHRLDNKVIHSNLSIIWEKLNKFYAN